MIWRLLVLVLLLQTEISLAQVACYKGHLTEQKISEDVAAARIFKPKQLEPRENVSVPSAEQFEKAGFELNSKTHVLSGALTKKSPPIKIGQIEILDAPFLYEWADIESSNQWIKQGGIKKAEMDHYLTRRSYMAAGQGYYVSKNPIDSQDYGLGLTVFRPKRKMIVLNAPRTSFVKPSDFSREFMLRLLQAGVDAIVVPTTLGSWYNVIRIDPLIRPTSFGGEYLFQAAQTKEGWNDLFDLATGLESFKVPSKSRPDLFRRSLFAFAEKSKLDQSPYWAASDIFDIRYVASVYKKMDMVEPLSIKKMIEIGKSYAKRKKDIDLGTINSLAKFQEAANYLFDTKIDFRNHGAEMGPDISTRKYIRTTKTAAVELQKNPFLNVIEKRVLKNHVDLEVHYPSVRNYQKYQDLLSADLIAEIQKLPAKSYESETANSLNQRIMQELTAHLFNKKSYEALARVWQIGEMDALSLYRTFVSIHPFGEANGRSARLFYEVLMLRNKNLNRVNETNLTLPLFDMDLLGTHKNMEKSLNLGLVLKIWIAEAVNDNDFAQRNYQALQMLMENEKSKDFVEPFPEMKDIAKENF